MSRILVTGGAGYIGSHCCKALAEAGFEPFVFDNLSTGHREAVRWGALIEGDMRDREALAGAMRRSRPEAVIHFAALSLVGESGVHPERYYDVNVVGTLRLIEAMRAASVERLVFSSTAAIYGEPDTVPIPESAPDGRAGSCLRGARSSCRSPGVRRSPASRTARTLGGTRERSTCPRPGEAGASSSFSARRTGERPCPARGRAIRDLRGSPGRNQPSSAPGRCRRS